MKDIHKKLMQQCLEDAADLVDEFNEEVGTQFDTEMRVGSDNVSKMAIMLYKSRTQERNMKMTHNGENLPNEDEAERMFG
jgi:hypothetical protein